MPEGITLSINERKWNAVFIISAITACGDTLLCMIICIRNEQHHRERSVAFIPIIHFEGLVQDCI